jgi:hypothetical protein
MCLAIITIENQNMHVVTNWAPRHIQIDLGEIYPLPEDHLLGRVGGSLGHL